MPGDGDCTQGTPYAFSANWGLTGDPAQSASGGHVFSFDAITVDTHGFAAVDDTVAVIPATGIYLVHGNWAGANNVSRTIQIRRNGTSIRGNAMGANNGVDSFTCVGHWVGCLEAGDEISVFGSGSVTVTFGWLQITRIPLPFVHALQNDDSSGTAAIEYSPESDIEGWWGGTGAPDTFTVTEDGDYVVSCTARAVGAQLTMQVFVNGVGFDYSAGPNFDRDPHLHTMLHLQAGDEVQIKGDASTATDDRDGNQNHFAMWLLPDCAAYVQARNDSDTISDPTGSYFALDAEVADTDGFHSNVTNNTRLTVPSGKEGTYLIWAGFYMNFGVVTAGYVIKNGTVTLDRNMHQGGEAGGYCVAIADLDVGDYIQLLAYTGSSGVTGSSIRLGMVRLEDLHYRRQICPGDPISFVPQIWRMR